MSSDVFLWSVVRSEWIKFRSVRSTIVGVVVAIVLTLGIGVLVTTLIRTHWNTATLATKLTFDPVSTSLAGVIFAQFAVGIIGSLFITSEYSASSMRTSLAAVPNRVELAAGKLIVLVTSIFIVGEVASFVTFFIGQAIYSGVVPTASLSSGVVLRSVILTGAYLTLMAAFVFSMGLILRQSVATISVFVSLLLVVPLVLFALPTSWQNDTRKFLPAELGHAMWSTSSVPHDFSTWTALVVLVIYVVVLFAVGTTMFVRRDA
jgi:ABC-type transport system involved in multi-copper enzyme maturation permease subunit